MPEWLMWPQIDAWMMALLVAASFFAGFVDSVVGGGGLIQLPVLFAAFPHALPATLIGTNKLVSVCGTTSAAVQYGRRTTIDWHSVVPASIAALAFAAAGALAATVVPASIFRAALPIVLIGVAVYVFGRKHLGQHHAPKHVGRAAQARGTAVGAAIGFYDGIFGPGTGSFLTFAFVHWFGFDFLRASAAAKVVNVACNLAGIVAFALVTKLWVGLALMLAVANVLGSLAGATLTLRLGSAFIRKMFLGVVIVLIAKSAYDGLKPWIRPVTPAKQTTPA